MRFGLGQLGLFLLVSLLPIQWAHLVSAGGFSIKPVHIGLLALTVGAIRSRATLPSLAAILRTASIFVIPYAAYLAVFYLSLLWSDDPTRAFRALAKESIYFAGFLLLAAQIATMDTARTARTLRAGAFCGVVIFLLYAFLVFNALGRNVVSEYLETIVAADARGLHHGFYPLLFNCDLSGACVAREEGRDGEFISTNLRNTLVGAFLLYMTIIGATRQMAGNRPLRAIAAYGFMVLLALLVLSSVSRSNIIGLLALFASLFFVRYLRSSGGVRIKPLRLVVVLVILGGALAIGSTFIAGLSSAVGDRLQAIGDDGRINLAASALSMIAERPIFGHGAGAALVVLGEGGYSNPHNLVLSAWLEAGVVAAFAALAWFLALVGIYFRALLRSAIPRADEPVQIRWIVAAIPLALVRVMVSGGSQFTLIEWTILALLFGFMAKGLLRAPAAGGKGAS